MLIRCLLAGGLVAVAAGPAFAEPLRKAASLEQLLKQTDVAVLAREARLRGDPKHGAVLFHRSAAACINCHSLDRKQPTLGPSFDALGENVDKTIQTDDYLIESLLYPSKALRKGFESTSILTDDGATIVGVVVDESADELALRTANDLEKPIHINKAVVEARSLGKQSLMPDGLVSALRDEGQFYDLAAFVLEVAAGGPSRLSELRPSPEALKGTEDWLNLDHAGIIKKLKAKDFEAGQAVYNGYCIDCHGSDGLRATVPTARAFTAQRMKFGGDPYKMFMTLSRGNGLMGPMSHLTPYERYQVVHYIRERFMKSKNPDYGSVDKNYLASLPTGTEDGTRVPNVDRDYGPALASNLERRVRSSLTLRLDGHSISWDLHTMKQADVWRGDFLDLQETPHIRNRGEGTARPNGRSIVGMGTWEWAHLELSESERKTFALRGPMPTKWIEYLGYYLYGPRLILNYRVHGREVLETVSADPKSQSIVHSLEIGPGPELFLSVAPVDPTNPPAVTFGDSDASLFYHAKPSITSTIRTRILSSDKRTAHYCNFTAVGEVDGFVVEGKRTFTGFSIPGDSKPRRFDIVRSYYEQAAQHRSVSLDGTRPAALTEALRDLTRHNSSMTSLRQSTKGGELIWPDRIRTKGLLGLQTGGYALDTIGIPESTPWKTWFRTSAMDFLSDGRMVVTTYGGDVWLVSGIDDRLLNIEWKRFAAGLYEPMGVKVVDDRIYVTCKDRIVRLHDADQNEEADFYENFFPDPDVAFHFHSFNFDLQTDSNGNFYYAKGGHGADFSLPGAVIRVSPDGKQSSIVATGFRAPNGMGVLPDDQLTCSDNQGQWMPASKINLLKQGGFYGWVPTYDGDGKWSPDGGKIDVTKVKPPRTFDQPLVWMPQEFDNSSGGQLWVDDARWGPLSGRLLHTSFGKGWLSYLMKQEIDGVSQAAIVKLPLDFRTGIMRGRVNPRDGQVYVTGLQGWNGGGRIGLLANGIQRIRYTGKPWKMVRDCRVEQDGLRIDFNFSVDAKSAGDLTAYTAEHWLYRWRAEYGSDMYSPTTGRVGPEKLSVQRVDISDDRQSVTLRIPALRPVDQAHLVVKIKADDGEPFEEEIYWTIHKLPK